MLIRVTIGIEVVRTGQALGIEMNPLFFPNTTAEQFAEATSRKAVDELKDKLMSRDRQRELSPEELERLGVPPRPSLLQDVIKGRRTEIDQLNGYIAHKGKELGLPTPMNDAIVELFGRFESGEAKPSPEHLENLKALIPS
jgi:2-dehydropantoate 2-reductase